MRGRLSARDAYGVALLLLAAAVLLSGMLATAPVPEAAADGSGRAGGVLARDYLTAARGGTVRAGNGVELKVPPRVMKRDGFASIRRSSGESFDIHIQAPWRGTLTVLLPFDGRGKPAISHRVDGRWVLVPATLVGKRARVRVRSLSVFHTDEQLRYGIETMNMSYTDFLDRKADFTGKGCYEGSSGCGKPWPYDRFNWSDDSCSGIPVIKEFYRDLFDGPCQQHDFGYRNFGNGLQLGRNDDTRQWIDDRFLTEMRRLCHDSFSKVWQIANKAMCLETANVMYDFLRAFGATAFYRPAPFPEPGKPVPDPIAPIEPLPQIEQQPLPELQPIPTTPPAVPARSTWSEQQGSLGANTFTNPYNASGMGLKIQPYQWVEVSCKLYAPQIVSANPDGYWYRIASPPWSNAYYAVANTFWNGDVPGQRPYVHNTDFAVPDC